MNPWFAKAVILTASVAMVVIRAPHGKRSREIEVADSRKGRLEIFLLALAWVAFFLSLIWIATSWLAFADIPLHPLPFISGSLLLALGLWLLHRTHTELGPNWSITLEIRQSHRLVTDGIYRHVRHPMYLAFVLYALGQALVLPNWVAGPAYLVAMALLIALRLGPEEALLRDRFGEDYDEYVSRTKRLIPGLW